VDHVDQIEHHGDRHLVLARLGLDVLDLLLVAVDEHDIAPLAVGVSSLGLVEHLGDALGVTLDEARCHSLVLRPWSLVRARSTLAAFGVTMESLEHVLRAARVRLLFPDRRHHRHALVRAPRFSFGHRVAEDRVCVSRLGGLARRVPQRLRPHRHALAVRRHHLKRLRAERVVGGRSPRCIERLEVRGRSKNKLFGLALRDMARGGVIDSLDTTRERSLHGRICDAFPQRQSIDLGREAEMLIPRETRVRLPGELEAVPVHRHAPEVRLEVASASSHLRPLRSRPVLDLLLLLREQRVQMTLKGMGAHSRHPVRDQLAQRDVVRRSGLGQFLEHGLQCLARLREGVDGRYAL